MLTLESIRTQLREMPPAVRLGLVILALGGVVDVVAHLGGIGAEAGHGHGHAPSEVAAHLIGFVGMVVIMLGVVVDGVRRTRPGRAADTSTGGS